MKLVCDASLDGESMHGLNLRKARPESGAHWPEQVLLGGAVVCCRFGVP